MHRQVQLLLIAVQFLTRLRVPFKLDYAPDALSRSARYFPLVGQLVGAVSAAILLLSGEFITGLLPALLAVGGGILVTGALHEDGLADTVDGLGGGRDIAHRLTIMKDSRIGTYGTIALILAIGIKVAAVAHIGSGWAALWILLGAHGCARAASAVTMATQVYVRDTGTAKLGDTSYNVTALEAVLAIVLATWPLLFLPGTIVIAGLALGIAAALWPLHKARKLLGGFTGDVLGAIEQAFEIGFLVGAAAALQG